MTDQLREAIAQLEHLPEPAQNEAAARIREMTAELADRRWDELLADPRSEAFFDQMAEQYEVAKREGGFGSPPNGPEAEA